MTHAGPEILHPIYRYGFVLEVIAESIVLFDLGHPNQCAGVAAEVGSAVKAFGFELHEPSDLIGVSAANRDLEVDVEG